MHAPRPKPEARSPKPSLPLSGYARSVVLLLLLAPGCAPPDPDALLRAYKLDEAAVAFESATGTPLSFDHPAADGLARRAAHDPSLTCAEIARRMRPVLLLDDTPLRGRLDLDLTMAALTPTLLAAFELGAVLVAVGRSSNPGERSAADGGDLPWSDGRLIGGATTSVEAAQLGATVDGAPPPRLVTVGMSDGSAQIFFTAQWKDGMWQTVNSLTPELAGTWINFADFGARQGADAARARYGDRLRSKP